MANDIDVSSTTWKEFATQLAAQDYADTTWASLIVAVPDERIPAEFLATKQALPLDVKSAPPDMIKAAAAVPIMSVDHLGAVVDFANSTAWAIPRQTLAGTWAVPCRDKFDMGGPEPEWPPPPDLGSSPEA